MNAQKRRNGLVNVGAAVMLSTVAGLGMARTAEAGIPVSYVTTTSPMSSISPKMAAVQCPFGSWVLGGTATINGAAEQVAIQAAFPTYDVGLGKSLFVVKAVEDLSGTLDSWSVTASAYCTSQVVAMLVDEPGAFDSEPIKSVTVECPAGTKVVGMGGEISTSVDSNPAALVGNIPPAAVVFQGFEANDDLTEVTARATEVGGALGGGYGPSWKVTAIAACAPQAYFDGLELRRNTEPGGGLLASETESRLELSCSSKSKKVIAAGSTINDYEMGQWYLFRFSPYNAFQNNRIVAEAYRNPEMGTILMKQTEYIICTDK